MPERLRRTIRGLEKMIEPLRYHFNDLEKQANRKPEGIDLIATVEILHKNLARIEQELVFMRERVDMELLLRNDSLSDDSLPLPGDTPPIEDDASSRRPTSRDESMETRETRVFSATGNPFEVPSAQDNEATRSNDRSHDETLILRPVNLGKKSPADPTETGPQSAKSSHEARPTDTDASETLRDRSMDETLVLNRRESNK